MSRSYDSNLDFSRSLVSDALKAYPRKSIDSIDIAIRITDSDGAVHVYAASAKGTCRLGKSIEKNHPAESVSKVEFTIRALEKFDENGRELYTSRLPQSWMSMNNLFDQLLFGYDSVSWCLQEHNDWRA